MSELIDIHCHILPGVDDGPATLAESIELTRMAEAEGITTIIATPHHRHPSFDNEGQSIMEAVKSFNLSLQEAGVNVTVIPSQEVRINGELLDQVHTGEILPLGVESNYILIEFPSNHIPHYAKNLFYDLNMRGYTPIIAHPERNKVLIENPSILYEFVKNGALTQITTSSLTGDFGKKIKKFTESLIESNLTHFLASDAHNSHERPFRMQEALGECEKLFGIDMVHQFKENAEMVLANNHVYILPPEPVKKRKKLLNIF